MPDVRSKIVLSAEGGDKAAREIRKMQSALDDVSKSAQKTTQGVSLGGVSADPFTRAVQSAGDETYRRTLRTAQEKEEMDRRGLAHQQLTTGQQQLGRAAQTVSGYGAAGVQAISGGRMAGGAGAALGGTGALMGMSGVGALTGVGIGLLAAAGIAKGVDMLSQKEEERVRMLYPLARKSDMTRSRSQCLCTAYRIRPVCYVLRKGRRWGYDQCRNRLACPNETNRNGIWSRRPVPWNHEETGIPGADKRADASLWSINLWSGTTG